MKRSRLFILVLIFMFTSLISCTKTDDEGPKVEIPNISLSISTKLSSYYVGDNIIVDIEVNPASELNNIIIETSLIDTEIIKNVVIPNSEGQLIVNAKHKNYDLVISESITLTIEKSIYDTDPYSNVSYQDFYLNYVESISLKDTNYRTNHGFMSGNIILPDEVPLTAKYQPKEDDMFIRNTNAYFSTDNNVYYIVDGYGEIVDMIFKNGGYISLDEVASYLLAFGTTPANYLQKKSGRPNESIWKEYLRLNNSAFSGSTTKYPYEPMLPNISGCGGDLYYYEVDFGTTGTTCDPNYDIEPYNNGTKITRGAARLVYTRYDANKNNIIDINEKYVFYTYNHYNDFQEYLNYQNGWGELFGNITGGGTLSSKTDYNPTPYVEVKREDFTKTKDIKIDTTSIMPYIRLTRKNKYIFG